MNLKFIINYFELNNLYTGNIKASVFPEPVFAAPKISFPARA